MNSNNFITTCLFLLLIATITFGFNTAKAAQLNLVTLDASRHYWSDNLNERHHGIGLEIIVKKRSYALTSYINSYNDDSWLITTARDGWLTGVATGYNSLPLFPIAGYQITMFKYFRLTITPVLVYGGLVIPLGNI